MVMIELPTRFQLPANKYSGWVDRSAKRLDERTASKRRISATDQWYNAAVTSESLRSRAFEAAFTRKLPAPTRPDCQMQLDRLTLN